MKSKEHPSMQAARASRNTAARRQLHTSPNPTTSLMALRSDAVRTGRNMLPGEWLLTARKRDSEVVSMRVGGARQGSCPGGGGSVEVLGEGGDVHGEVVR